MSRRISTLAIGSLAVLAFLCLSIRQAYADAPLGTYIGAAVGQAHVEASGKVVVAGGNVFSDSGRFDETHAALKVIAGLRPIALLGAELSYMDFGHPSGGFNTNPATTSMSGESAFAVIYVPVPVITPVLKAGVARIESKLRGTGFFAPNCSPTVPCPQYVGIAPFEIDRTNTAFAWGGGMQHGFGALAARVEYERFSAGGEHPSLLSLALTLSF